MRILIIRTSAMGDIVHGLPTLRALRRGFPQATIGWVVEDVFAPLLANDPDRRRSMGEAGWRRTIDHFSWEKERVELLRILGLSKQPA